MFVSISKTQLVPPGSIKYVKYTLHETFKKTERIVRKSPFYLTIRGWGQFCVDAKIVFKDEKKKTCNTGHYLNFDNHATITQFYPDINDQSSVKRERRRPIRFKKEKDYKVSQ